MKAVILVSILCMALLHSNGQSSQLTDSVQKSPKQVYVCSMHPEIVSDKPGKCPKCGMDLVLQAEQGNMNPDNMNMKMNCPMMNMNSMDSSGEAKSKDEVYYTCEMHPEIHEKKAGTCSKCGMALTKVIVKKEKKSKKKSSEHSGCGMMLP